MIITEYQKLNHSVWECKYHVVFIPKYRKKILFGALRGQIGPVFKQLARQYGCDILEGHVMTDHVHMLLSMPPKLKVCDVVGYIKGKSAIYRKKFSGKRKEFYR